MIPNLSSVCCCYPACREYCGYRGIPSSAKSTLSNVQPFKEDLLIVLPFRPVSLQVYSLYWANAMRVVVHCLKHRCLIREVKLQLGGIHL